MAKYRKKPVIIEAIQFKRENIKDVKEFITGVCHIFYVQGMVTHIEIETLEGDMKANIGDYIIKGVKGEFYPCKPDIFKATYEKVN